MIKKIKKGKKIKLSKNFWSDEWDCHCSHRDCTHTFISTDLVKELQKKRSEWKRAIVLSSGYRCPYWNKKKGGARKSQHLLGTAADIAVAGKSHPGSQITVRTLMDSVVTRSTVSHMSMSEVAKNSDGRSGKCLPKK